MFIKLIYTILFIKALKKNGKFINVQEVMDQWTLQMGYPVITILGNTTAENWIIITQQHFIYDIRTKTKAPALQNNRYNSFFLLENLLLFLCFTLHFHVLKSVDITNLKCFKRNIVSISLSTYGISLITYGIFILIPLLLPFSDSLTIKMIAHLNYFV